MDLGRFKRLGGSLRLSGNSQPPIALDFGASSLKALQVGAGDLPELISAAAIDTPDELMANPAKRIAFQIEALPDLIRAGRFKGKRAVCGIPAGHTVVKHLQAQPTQGWPRRVRSTTRRGPTT